MDRRAAVGILAAAIVVLSVLPDAGTGRTALYGIGLDKWLHAAGYAAFAATTAWAWRTTERTALLGAALAAVVLGAGVEVAQAAVPGRDPSALDLLANAVGAALGAAGYRLRTVRSGRP